MEIENLRSNLSSAVYDTVDKATKLSSEKKAELETLQSELRLTLIEIETLEEELVTQKIPQLELPQANLTSVQKEKAEVLGRCLKMASQMTACNSDGTTRLTCGNVVLKSGDTFEGLQANWDLIDTITGADA